MPFPATPYNPLSGGGLEFILSGSKPGAMGVSFLWVQLATVVVSTLRLSLVAFVVTTDHFGSLVFYRIP